MADDRDGMDENEGLMDELSRAIVEAMVNSPEVKKAMTKLTGRENLCSSSFLMLMLKVKNLSDSMNVGSKGSGGGAGSPKKDDCGGEGVNNANSPLPEQFTDFSSEISCDFVEDGKRLTKGEVDFRDFLSDKFDEMAWLKKHGIVY